MPENQKPNPQNPTPNTGVSNPLDAPFGEPFATYLARKFPDETMITKPKLPTPRRAAPPAKAGSYTHKITAQLPGTTVYHIDKQHIGPWHPIRQILESLQLKAPYGHGTLDKLSPSTATLKIHSD